MNDSFAMSGSQTKRDLQRVVRRLAHRQRCAIHLLAQRLAFEQFTHEIRGAFMHTGIVNGQHVRMIQHHQRLGFLLEAPQPIRVRHEILRQYLDRNLAIQPRVAGTKHFAHSARADARDDSVLIEQCADHFFSRNSSNQFKTTRTFGFLARDESSGSFCNMRKRSPSDATS